MLRLRVSMPPGMLDSLLRPLGLCGLFPAKRTPFARQKRQRPLSRALSSNERKRDSVAAALGVLRETVGSGVPGPAVE
jgi:hypothetical protein